jgi:hypothetical protein
MNPIGFVAVPRTELNSPAGAFFLASVEAKTGPGMWKVTLDGKTMVVQSDLNLVPGQTLRLKLISQTEGRWLFQIADRAAAAPDPVIVGDPALFAAFVSRGLPVAGERLAAWTRWLSQPGPSDKADWAASLEARSVPPDSPIAQAFEPWLAWQSSLERGERRSPPEDDPWDLWNVRRPTGEPWLVLPITWEYHGDRDSGLLQAHWSAVSQTVDRWNLTAAPAGVPFRLEAQARRGHLDFVWRFFAENDRRAWESLAHGWEKTLTTPDLAVTLKVTGPAASSPPSGGIDVSV